MSESSYNMSMIADDIGRASSIQEAITNLRIALGVPSAATYTEDLSAVMRRLAENLSDREVSDFVDRLSAAVSENKPVELWGVEYLPASKAVELPVDADGEVIHVGDIMIWKCLNGIPPCFYVTDLRLTADGWIVKDGLSSSGPDLLIHKPKRRTIDDVKTDMRSAFAGGKAAVADALVQEAYEMGLNSKRSALNKKIDACQQNVI